jgi:ABC-type methionine transport system permease subunit
MQAYNKAIVALVMALIQLANVAFGASIGLDQPTVTALVAAAAPFLVWLVPNGQSLP